MADDPSTTGQRDRLRSSWEVTLAAGKQMGAGGTDRAAAMAYYAIQALFPGIFVVVIVSLLLSTEGSIGEAIDWAVSRGMDRNLGDTLESSISSAAERASGAASFAALIAALAAISGASGWFAAVGRAIEPDPERRRQRNMIAGRVRAGLWTVALVVLFIAAITVMAAGGEVADELFSWIGLSEGAPLVWSIVRPLLVVTGIVGAVLLIYRAAPDRRTPIPLRDLLPGAIVGGLGWVLASLGFFFYIGNLANIGATYGAFATPIVLLLWLYLTGVVVLFGAAINGELARRRGELPGPRQLPGADNADVAGHPAGRLPTAAEAP